MQWHLIIFMVVILFKPQGLLGSQRGAQGMKKLNLIIGILLIAVLAIRARIFKKLWCAHLHHMVGVHHRHHGSEFDGGLRGAKVPRPRRILRHWRLYRCAVPRSSGLSFWLALPVGSHQLRFLVGIAGGLASTAGTNHLPGVCHLGLQHRHAWLVMRNEEWLTGGTFGINNIARPSIGSLSLDGNLAYYYLVLSSSRCCWPCCYGALLRSPWGKAFTALRDNPIRAESLGIDTRRYTLLSVRHWRRLRRYCRRPLRVASWLH
jgi:branched-chain amino acid transport system permease protein